MQDKIKFKDIMKEMSPLPQPSEKSKNYIDNYNVGKDYVEWKENHAVSISLNNINPFIRAFNGITTSPDKIKSSSAGRIKLTKYDGKNINFNGIKTPLEIIYQIHNILKGL